MFKVLFLIWLFSVSSTSTSASLLKSKPRRSSYYIADRLSFRSFIKESKIVPINDQEPVENFLDRDTMKSESESKYTEPHNHCKNLFLLLPEVFLEEIFEYLPSDYTSIRMICKSFADSCDQMNYRVTWMNFPNGTPVTFAKYSKYMFSRLSIIFLKLKPLRNQLDKELNLKQTVIEVIIFLRDYNMEDSLIAISFFFKMHLVYWSSIAYTIRMTDINYAWYLGLLTFAQELASANVCVFLHSIGPSNSGIITALENQHHELVRFMADVMSRVSKTALAFDPRYMGTVVGTCIKMRNWDVLSRIYKENRELNYKIHLMDLAKTGSITGLHVLKDEVRKHPQLLAHHAAADGHLDFLRALDRLGILLEAATMNEYGETAVHAAAISGETECLIFLVERLGKRLDCLNIREKDGHLPLHFAASMGNHETLREIILRNPRYKSMNLFKRIISPLHDAVSCGQTESARILLDYFPELINFKDSDGNTAIHLSVENGSGELLSLLLSRASDRAIKSTNRKGDTALHISTKHAQVDKIIFLLATGCFTGLERNKAGMTPIGLLVIKHPHIGVRRFRELFKLSLEDCIEALSPEFNNCLF